MRTLTSITALIALSLGVSFAQKKLTLKDLPPAVQTTIQAELKGGEIKNIGKETENKITQYEVETMLNGKHRDFNVDKRAADLRYDTWLRELFSQNNVMGLMFGNTLAGFFAISDNRILLHALDPAFRGRGLSKFFWSAACKALFETGHNELVSSVSASNVVVLNVYASLGFKFRRPLDVYHRLVL